MDYLGTKEEAAEGGCDDTYRSKLCLGAKGREGIVNILGSYLRGF